MNITIHANNNPMIVTIDDVTEAALLQLVDKFFAPLFPLQPLPAIELTPAAQLDALAPPAATPVQSPVSNLQSSPSKIVTSNGTRKPAGPVTLFSDPAKRRLGWDEFDRLTRAEMKRLAPTPGVMPGNKLWNEQRADPLPTLDAVCSRYGVDNPAQLAVKLGMEPPIGTQGRTLRKVEQAEQTEPETAVAA